MSKKTVYFGTRDKMSWVKAPSINMIRGIEKFGNSGTYTNGGGYVNDSSGSHENYNLSWSLTDSADIDLVQAYYSKVYGDGLVYWLDPFVCSRNALPLAWSVPALAGDDAVTLLKDRKPTIVKTAANSIGLPVNTAVYSMAGAVSKTIWVPVPEGQSVALGIVGSRTGNGQVQYATDAAPSTWVNIPLLVASASTSVNTFVDNLGGGVSLRLSGSTGTLSLAAMTLKVLSNSNIVGSGLVTNLATNPSFESTSGTVEVRRNLIPAPLITSSLAGWTIRSPEVTDGGVTTAGRAMNIAGTVVASSYLLAAPAPALLAVGEALSGSFSVLNSGTTPIVLRAGIYWAGPNAYAYGPDVTIQPGAYGVLAVVGAIVPAGTTVASFRVISGGVTTGQQFTVTNFTTLEKSPVLGSRFNGSGDTAPDPDLTHSWTGAVNNSPSVLTGTRASGTWVGWQSKQWSSTGVYSHYIPQGSVQEYVIGAGESFQIQPRTNGQTYIVNGDPHVTTEDPVHVNGPAMIETGAGWWDNHMRTDQEYDGPYFDGSTPTTNTYAYYWNGPVNNNTSTRKQLPYINEPNKFVIGGGNSGMKFVPNTFERNGYSAVIGQGLESAAVQLKEVGSWQR